MIRTLINPKGRCCSRSSGIIAVPHDEVIEPGHRMCGFVIRGPGAICNDTVDRTGRTRQLTKLELDSAL